MSANSAMTDVRAISFDLDDTLWDCASVISYAEQTAWDWFHVNAPRVTDSHDWSVIPKLRSEIVARAPNLVSDVTRLRRAIFSELLQRHDYAAELADTAFDVFYTARSQVTLYDGVVDMLDKLKPNFKLAAITNGNADLSLIGIDHYFDDIQFASVDCPPKPDNFMFEQCLNNLSIDAAQMLHIGDNPHTDVFGAQCAGVQSVWFNQTSAIWPDDLPAPDFTAHSINELTNILMVNSK